MTSHGPSDRVPAPEAKLPLDEGVSEPGYEYLRQHTAAELAADIDDVPGEVVWVYEKTDLAKLTDEVAGLKDVVGELLSAIGRAAESEAVTRHQLMKVMEAHRQATIAQTQAMRGGAR